MIQLLGISKKGAGGGDTVHINTKTIYDANTIYFEIPIESYGDTKTFYIDPAKLIDGYDYGIAIKDSNNLLGYNDESSYPYSVVTISAKNISKTLNDISVKSEINSIQYYLIKFSSSLDITTFFSTGLEFSISTKPDASTNTSNISITISATNTSYDEADTIEFPSIIDLTSKHKVRYIDLSNFIKKEKPRTKTQTVFTANTINDLGELNEYRYVDLTGWYKPSGTYNMKAFPGASYNIPSYYTATVQYANIPIHDFTSNGYCQVINKQNNSSFPNGSSSTYKIIYPGVYLFECIIAKAHQSANDNVKNIGYADAKVKLECYESNAVQATVVENLLSSAYRLRDAAYNMEWMYFRTSGTTAATDIGTYYHHIVAHFCVAVYLPYGRTYRITYENLQTATSATNMSMTASLKYITNACISSNYGTKIDNFYTFDLIWSVRAIALTAGSETKDITIPETGIYTLLCMGRNNAAVVDVTSISMLDYEGTVINLKSYGTMGVYRLQGPTGSGSGYGAHIYTYTFNARKGSILRLVYPTVIPTNPVCRYYSLIREYQIA